jgi:hypothetical protein
VHRRQVTTSHFNKVPFGPMGSSTPSKRLFAVLKVARMAWAVLKVARMAFS